MKRPYFAFYPKDWNGDPALKACSMSARALWIDMLCIMHEGLPYGYLTLPNGHPIDTKTLSRMVPNCDSNGTRWVQKCERLVDELITKGVLKRDQNGLFYSKKMVSDEADRQSWRDRQTKQRSKDVTQKSPPITNTITNTTTLKDNPPTPQKGGGDVLKKEKPKPKEDHLALAALMAEKVKEAVPLAKIPENLDSWADTIRLIVEVDKIPLPEVESVFLWANKDAFWYKNILCPNTLRRQMGRLDAKRTEEAAKLKATAKDTKPYAIKLLDHPRVRNRWTGQVYRTDDVLVDPTCKIFGNKGSLTVKATGEQMSAEDWEGVA